jgi:4-hydroxy-3-polyprenylbenzoate decarboxylase
MYRVQIYDRNTTGMHWQMHKVGAQHHREAQEKNRRSKPRFAWAAIRVCRFAPSRRCPKRSTK